MYIYKTSVYLMLLLTFTVAPIFAGCARTRIINGNIYKILSEDEEIKLVETARKAVLKKKAAMTGDECREIAAKTPELALDYRNDYGGEADIIWKLKEHTVTVHIVGKDLRDTPFWELRIAPVLPDTVRSDGKTAPKTAAH